MSSFHKVLPGNIRVERTREGWYMKEFGRRLGWATSKVSKVERGETNISVEELVLICRTLGRTLSELAVGCDPDELTILGL